jgi:hypothetical protein
VFTVNVKSTFDNAPEDITKVVNRQWTITEAVAGGSSDTMRFSWVTADQAASFNPASVSVMRWTGSTWEYFPATVTGTGTITDPYVAKVIGITEVGKFGLTSFAPLPLRILSFNGVLKNDRANLSWTATEQVNVSHFDVEESTDGTAFRKIGSVDASINNAVNNYSFVNPSILSGKAYYRLKIVDVDGRSQYSSVVFLKNITKNKLTLNSTVINNGKLTLSIPELAAGNYQIALYTTNGQLIQSQSINHNGSDFLQTVSLKKSNVSGVYFVKINGNNFNEQASFIIQ